MFSTCPHHCIEIFSSNTNIPSLPRHSTTRIANSNQVLEDTYSKQPPGTRRHVLQTATRHSNTRIANSYQALEDTYCKQLPGTRRHVLQTATRHSKTRIANKYQHSKTRIANSNLTFVSTRSYRHIYFTDFHLSFCYNQN